MFWGSEAGFCNPSHTFGLQRGRAGLPGLSESLLIIYNVLGLRGWILQPLPHIWPSEAGFCNPSHTFGLQRGSAGLPGPSGPLLFTYVFGLRGWILQPLPHISPPGLPVPSETLLFTMVWGPGAPKCCAAGAFSHTWGPRSQHVHRKPRSSNSTN